MKEPVKDLTAIIQRTLDVAIYHEDEVEPEDVADRCVNAYKLIKHIEDTCTDIYKAGDYPRAVDVELLKLRDICVDARNSIATAGQAVRDAWDETREDAHPSE